MSSGKSGYKSCKLPSQIPLTHSQPFANRAIALQETETNATNLCQEERSRKRGQKKTLLMKELAEAAGILADCLLLTAWVHFSFRAGMRARVMGRRSLKSLRGYLPPLQRPKALTSSPRKYRAQNTMKLKWEVRRSLCDSN